YLHEFEHKAQRKPEDWAADTTAEPELVLEQLVDDEARQRLEAIKAAEEELKEAEAAIEFADDDEGADDAQGDRKRRRRRRRRRGGRNGADDGANDRLDADEAPAPRERDTTPRDANAERDQDGDGDGDGRRRRRRRRRGGRSGERSGDSQFTETAAHHDAETDTKRREREDMYGKLAPSGYPFRGDSWDLEPSAITLKTFDQDFADKVRDGVPAEAPAGLVEARANGASAPPDVETSNGSPRGEASDESGRDRGRRDGPGRRGGRNRRDVRRDDREPRAERPPSSSRDAEQSVETSTASASAAPSGPETADKSRRRVAPADILGGSGVQLANADASTPKKPPKRAAASRSAPKAERKKEDAGAMPVMIKPVRSIGPRARS
ncbi:MAG: hypothetical protein KDE45_22780, partial [Caldilineaceae bacterium]|nr:hypothetical protein [Caldilineaceae bacterium]